MSLLARILAAKEPLFDLALRELEERTGRTGVDAKLAAEMAEHVARASQRLDLEAAAAGPKLYEALLQKVQHDDAQLAEQIGGKHPNSFSHMLPLIEAAVNRLSIARSGWFLKEAVAHTMLQAMPPLRVMKRLGYHSVDDLLAQEDLFEVYGSLRFAEEPQWLDQFIKQYHKLSATDFTARDIKLISLDRDKWGDLADAFIQKKLHNVTHLKELGVIILMPVPDIFMPGVTLKIMPLILHYYNEIRLYSTYFKLIQDKVNYGDVLARTLIADTPNVSIMSGQVVHWRVIQRYFGKLKHERHPEIFEPHVHPEDLHYRKVEHTLLELDPRLSFWRDMDYVATVRAGDIVSFNLMDVSLSYSNEASYADRYLYHMREALWNEVFARYFSQKTLEKQILLRLDNELIAPEKIPAPT